MKKSLLTTLVIWIGAGCGYYFLLHGRYESPADWVTALVGSTTTMLWIGCFRSLLLAYQDKRLLQGSRQARLPNTKKMVAVTGRIISRRSMVNLDHTALNIN